MGSSPGGGRKGSLWNFGGVLTSYCGEKTCVECKVNVQIESEQ